MTASAAGRERGFDAVAVAGVALFFISRMTAASCVTGASGGRVLGGSAAGCRGLREPRRGRFLLRRRGRSAVPMSRPSMTTPPRSPSLRCWETIQARRRGWTETLRGRGGYVFLADAAGDVDAVEENAVAFELRFEGDVRIFGEGEEGVLFVEAEVVLDGLERERAVHGAGLKIEEAETAREVGGHGAVCRRLQGRRWR